MANEALAEAAAVVFVYGTLKESFANVHVNAGRRVPGDFETVERFPLYVIGEYRPKEVRPKAVDLLLAVAAMEPRHAEEIFRRMLARMPDRALPIYRAWLTSLERAGERVRYETVLDEARGRLGPEAFPGT